MMIRFYPRDIGMWRTDASKEHFDLSIRNASIITLQARYKYDYKDFYTREELIDFLKQFGVRLDDATYPLIFGEMEQHPYHKTPRRPVIQCLLIGWVEGFV